jgi:hypothetical protein
MMLGGWGKCWTTLFIFTTLLGCSGGEETPQTPPVQNTTVVEEKEPTVTENFERVKARLKVVGLDGKPILGMAPIATRQPNAFDEPVAVGPLSNADGLTEFEFPGDEKLYIRAWDPERKYFANNYFDALPNTGNVSDELLIQMAPGVFVTGIVHDENGSPLADTNITAMLYHPSLGPWWPAKASTDSTGKLQLGPVPPGQFTLRLKTEDGRTLELPATPLPPGEATDLGGLVLQ